MWWHHLLLLGPLIFIFDSRLIKAAENSVAATGSAIPPPPPSLNFEYHDYDALTTYLHDLSASYPNLTALYSIGQSVQGRELWVLVVGTSPYEHVVGRPNVKLVANMHGNEAIGRELLLHLSEHLVEAFATDRFVRWLLENTRLHLMPSMNPDGFEVAKEGECDGGQGRYNSLGFDLNRNFPDYFKQNGKRAQPETEAVRKWISRLQFVLSANLHGGALVASYPFDNAPNSSSAPSPSLTPDDDVFKHLASTYASAHPRMRQGRPCKDGQRGFQGGVTNGAQWYPLTGGMQDYNYVWHGCFEITLELSCCKFPPAHQLNAFWSENREPLLRFLREAHRGVRGFVLDAHTGAPLEGAALRIKGRPVAFQSTRHGEFWRLLLPGTYRLEVFADGYEPQELPFNVASQSPTLLNVTLIRRGDSDNRGSTVVTPTFVDHSLIVFPTEA